MFRVARFELNHMPDFRGVMEKDLESIIRRSLVIKFRARFFPKLYLEKCLPNHEEYGIFARDEGLGDFARFRTARARRPRHVIEALSS